MIPLIIGAGAGLDYARAMLVRQQMGEALDSAALAVGSTTGLDQAKAQDLAQKYFDANYTVDRTVYGSPTVSIPASGYDNKGSVLLTASNSMPTVLMKVAGITSVPIATASSVVWGQSKLWVALVLDNSGSMSQGDANGTKMSALKSASQQLLTVLQNASAHAGDVKAGIVPFTNVVKVGAGNVGASWLDWTDWEAAPKDSSGVTIDDAYLIPKSGVPLAAYGPHDDCPFTTTKTKNKNTTVSQDAPFGFSCQKNPNNNSGNVAAGAGASPIPPSGLICPTSNSAAFDNDHLARYYNGCWSSTAVPGATIQVSSGNGATCAGFNPANCSCSNNVCSTQKWTHVWVPNDHSSWSGCVADRRQDYDIQNTQPSGVSGFTAANPLSCIAASVTPLEYDWTAL
ncbi:MAG TPA: pilus assembly protein TadG-related protein, partial [Rhizomicrobium sp.]|nr:pilus assembly protein TadG-related protein [Rhizomicrobium sp.]